MTAQSADDRQPLLSVRGLDAGYGAMQVVHEVDLDVRAGEMVSIVGRNGAGKTTTVSAIAGALPGHFSGSVSLYGRSINAMGPKELLGQGLVFVPAGHRVFKEMTARENLRLGAFSGGAVRRRQAEASIGRVIKLFPALETHLNRDAGLLSGGQQQMLAIGQALMAEPRILILDEPTSGLAMIINTELYSVLARLVTEGIGVLVVEQDVERAIKYSHRCYVIENGRVVLEGATAELARSQRVREIVTGVSAARDDA